MESREKIKSIEESVESEIGGRSIFTPRHLAEIGILALTCFFLLNPFDITLKAAAANLSPETIKSMVLSLGVLAPVGMVAFDWLQVVAAPMPPVTMVASGFTFGMVQGSILTFIGMSLGSWTALLLGRRYGQRVVDRFVSDAHMKSFYEKTREHGLVVFIVLMLLPGFPDDVFCYLAGLTDIDMKKLAVAAPLGRIPTVFTLVLTGNSIALAQTKLMAAALGGFILVSAVCVRYEKQIVDFAAGAGSRIEGWTTFG